MAILLRVSHGLPRIVTRVEEGILAYRVSLSDMVAVYVVEGQGRVGVNFDSVEGPIEQGGQTAVSQGGSSSRGLVETSAIVLLLWAVQGKIERPRTIRQDLLLFTIHRSPVDGLVLVGNGQGSDWWAMRLCARPELPRPD